MTKPDQQYVYPDSQQRWDDEYVWSPVERELLRVAAPGARVFELGCGNGIAAQRMRSRGFAVTAVDPSVSGIEMAKAVHRGIDFHIGTTDDPLAARFGQHAVVVSIEVIEHCFSPRRFADCAFELLEPGGRLILTTPYHGYLKNLVLAATGKLDTHFTALWEGGHIKFFSIPSITALLTEAGFEDLRAQRVGRIAPLAKSMVVSARRPR